LYFVSRRSLNSSRKVEFGASGDCRNYTGDVEEPRPSARNSEPRRCAVEPKQARGPLQAAVETVTLIEIASRRARQREQRMPIRSSLNYLVRAHDGRLQHLDAEGPSELTCVKKCAASSLPA
jgi:hypothetical protein